MDVKTFNLVVSGLNNLRDEVAAEIEEDRQEKKEVLGLFEALFTTAYEKAGRD